MIEELVFSLLDDHFLVDMMMGSSRRGSERHYFDSHVYMIFVYEESKLSTHLGPTPNGLRILISFSGKKSYKEDGFMLPNRFAKSVFLPGYLNKESLVSFIKESYKLHSSLENKNFLDEWYKIKKVEVRDIKLSNLGI